MNRKEIDKLPTPETEKEMMLHFYADAVSGELRDAVPVKFAERLEQRLAAAVMELRELESLSVGPAGYCSFPIGDQLRKARETLAAIKELNK